MPERLTREIGLLRALAAHLERRELPFDSVTQEFMRKEGFGHVRDRAGGILAIRVPGHHAFSALTDCLLDRVPAIERGATYSDVQSELFNFIAEYIGRAPSTVGEGDAGALLSHFERWFADKAAPRRVFVPCVISRTPAPRFEIGPVTFEHIDRVTTTDFYPRGDGDAAIDQRGFDDLVDWMRKEDGNWMARVGVDGCEPKRAEEIAELAVDLVIVAFQLAAPYLDTRTMSRLDARRGTSQKRTLSEADGYHWVGWTRKEPGMSIGQGTLAAILQRAEPIFTAVGNVVRAFATGSFRMPNLERAWCDAAYWLHEALAESIDTIAIAKLETALEVLLRAESSRGSERRMRDTLEAFFSLGPDDPVTPGSLLSARQFARKVVGDRSQILHGTWSTLFTRGIDREGMEGFAIAVLRSAVVELDGYSNTDGRTDDVDGFLCWVRERRKKTISANP